MSANGLVCPGWNNGWFVSASDLVYPGWNNGWLVSASDLVIPDWNQQLGDVSKWSCLPWLKPRLVGVSQWSCLPSLKPRLAGLVYHDLNHGWFLSANGLVSMAETMPGWRPKCFMSEGYLVCFAACLYPNPCPSALLWPEAYSGRYHAPFMQLHCLWFFVPVHFPRPTKKY
jgi:hypothetical protein